MTERPDVSAVFTAPNVKSDIEGYLFAYGGGIFVGIIVGLYIGEWIWT